MPLKLKTISPRNRVEKAKGFPDIRRIICQRFEINENMWQLSADAGLRAIRGLKRAEQSTDPLDRALQGESLFRAMPMPDTFENMGVDIDDFKHRAKALYPKGEKNGIESDIGTIAYQHYTEAGALPGDVLSLVDTIKAADKQTSDKIKEQGELVNKNYGKLNAAIAEYRRDAGWDRERAKFYKVHSEDVAPRADAGTEFQDGRIDRIEFNKKIAALNEKLRAATRAWNEFANKVQAHEIGLHSKYVGNSEHVQQETDNKEMDAALQAFYAKTVSVALESSPISEKDAQDWAGKQVIAPALKSRLKKSGYGEAQFKDDTAEFYRLCGGRVGTIEFKTTRKKRSFAMVESNQVHLSAKSDKRTIFHEMAHLLENQPVVKAANNRFIDKKTGGRQKMASLRSLTGNRGYKSNEKAFVDHFFDPYVGKYYPGGITEVGSMGFQMFADPKKMAMLYDQDPEMFQYILGVVRSPMTSVEKEAVDLMVTKRQENIDAVAVGKKFYAALDKKSKNIDKIIEGSYYRFEGTLSRFRVMFKDDYILAATVTKKIAQQFLYMYLWQLSISPRVGRPTDSNLEYCIKNNIIPHTLKIDDRYKTIPDITVLDVDKMPKDLAEFTAGADEFIKWLKGKAFSLSPYSYDTENYEYSKGGKSIMAKVRRGEHGTVLIEDRTDFENLSVDSLYRFREKSVKEIFKSARADIQKIIGDE
jgi:hypothetical protein